MSKKIEVARDVLEHAQNDPVFKRALTWVKIHHKCDTGWSLHYIPAGSKKCQCGQRVQC